MQSFFPTASTLSATFGHASPYTSFQSPAPMKRSPYQARSHLYPSWDVVEDAKNKAAGLTDAATKEIEKASNLAQAKAGKIELYSGKYYAVCFNQPDHNPPTEQLLILSSLVHSAV
jgi:solute carrier family 25 phosphate transporter 3